MSYWYPQASIKLRILFEDFDLTSDASKQIPYEFSVVAKDITVNRNDYKSSSSFNATIEYKNFPFDPRTIRACGVIVYIQDMESLYGKDGALNTIVPGAATKIDPSVTNAVFAGFVDEDTISFDDSKREVRFEGRDYTALLIDQKYPEKSPLALNTPIDVAIRTFLSKFKATQEIIIDNRTGSTTLPTLAQYSQDFNSKLAAQKNTGAHESYWEIIQDIVSRAGLVCYIQLDKLIITTPRNLHASNKDVKMIYGQNVKTLTFKRKLGRYKNFNVRVRSRVGKHVLTANIPEEATPAWCKSFGISRLPVQIPVLTPSGAVDTTQVHLAPYISYPVPNIADKNALIRIGQTVYEEYSFQQIEGTIETFEMLVHSGADEKDPNWQAFDVCHLDIGQPIRLEIATDDLEAISRLPNVDQRVQYLKLHNYREDVATVFAQSMGKTSPRFFTKSYSLTLNQDSGFKLHLDFINILDLTNRGLP